MLHSTRKLKGCAVAATDGEIGKIDDVYFDDQKWAIRYFVVDTGGWLTGRKVLISPISVREVDWRNRSVHVALTRRQIKDSPGIDTEQPVSRRQEAEFFRHYDYPLYWTGPLLWGFGAFPPLGGLLHTDSASTAETATSAEHDHADSHLRSNAEVIGYEIQETNGSLGHVDDFLFNERDWSIRFMIVDTGHWWPGKHVLLSPQLIRDVNWPSRHVIVDATREAVQGSPEYDPAHPPAPDEAADMYQRIHGPPDGG
jgi:uncharacterized protein YrrD